MKVSIGWSRLSLSILYSEKEHRQLQWEFSKMMSFNKIIKLNVMWNYAHILEGSWMYAHVWYLHSCPTANINNTLFSFTVCNDKPCYYITPKCFSWYFWFNIWLALTELQVISTVCPFLALWSTLVSFLFTDNSIISHLQVIDIPLLHGGIQPFFKNTYTSWWCLVLGCIRTC